VNGRDLALLRMIQCDVAAQFDTKRPGHKSLS